MSTNPFVSAAHHIKDTFSDAMQRLSTSGHSQQQQQNQSNSTSHEQNNSRQLSMDTSNIAKVLVIGETGSGKSTFINYLTNYFLGGTLQNIKIAIPSKFRPHITEQFSHCENNLRDTTQSKTDRCNQYIYVDPNSPAQRQYLFLDTPGLSDTRGAEQDNINMMKIIDGVEGLGGLSAVIIVVNGTTGRLTLNLRNVIARLRGNLPDVVMDNVIVVMTNAKRHEANFNISSLQLHGTVYPYYMQNSAFSQDPSTWDQAALDSLQLDWDASMDELRRMIETIDTFKTKSVTAFKDMKDIRNAIKALMHEARLEVSQIQKMQDELAAFEHALKQYKNDEVNYKDYTRERVVETKELVDAKYHSTVCRKCDFVCHDKCGLNETTTHGNRIFQRCWAMSPEGQCFVCPSHCLYTEHYHARKTMKVKQQKLQDVLHDIKAKYDLATKNKSDFQTRITTTHEAKKMLEKALKQKLEEIKQKCAELRRICSGFNLAQELHALIDQLKAEATMLRNIEAKQQAEEFIRSLSEFCRQLEADQNSKQVLPPMRLVDTYTSKPLRSATSTGSASATPLSPPPPPPTSSENTPNLNTNVLDLIAKLNKAKKPQAVSSGDDDNDDEDESNADENNDEDSPRGGRTARSNNDHDEEVSTINGRRRRRQSNAGTATANSNPQQQFTAVSTDDLVQRYNDSKDPKKCHAILTELNRRAQGKSTGPLTSPTDISAFSRFSQLYGSQDTPTLSHVYLQLQQRISTITEPDILNITRVPNALLLEISAIYTLISEREKQTQSQNGPMSNEGLYERPPDHIAAAMMQKMATPIPQTPMGFYGMSIGHHPGGATTTAMQPQPQLQTQPSTTTTTTATATTAANPLTTNTHFKPIDTTQLPSASMTTQSSMFSPAPPQPAPVPMPSSLSSSSSITGTTAFSSQPLSPPLQLTSPSTFSQVQPPLSFSNFAGFQSPTTTNPVSSPQFGFPPSTTTQSSPFTTNPFSNATAASVTVDRSTNQSPFTFISPPSTNSADSSFSFVSSAPVSAGKDDYTMVNITPMPNVTTNDDDQNNRNPLATASQARLLSLYNEAKFSNKNAQLFAIYQELERRCAGINCQQLAKDYPAVYQTRLDEYASKSVYELKQLYHNVQQQVQARTQNDATHINDIPKELLIESFALLAAIKRKEP